jgi:phosphomannomutase
MLSVSGARGIVGQTMTPAVAADLAAAFGSELVARHGLGARVCLGRDSRPSGPMLAAAAQAGLIGTGCAVIDLGLVATPSVGVMIDVHDAAGGMVVTASHNPLPWNGLKCLNADGVAPPPAEAQRIIDRFERRDISYVEVPDLQTTQRDDSTNETHVSRILGEIDAEPIARHRLRVVLDSVNGAGCEAGRLLLERLGCELVHLNGEPTGRFAHVPEPVRENLVELADRTAAEGAAVGFAQDPDADRLAIVDERGVYIGEEYTLALAVRRLLDLRGAGMLAANLSTSRMIDDLAAACSGSRVTRTPVGEANVVEAMKAGGAIVGGEGNGGVIFPPVCWVRDSLSSMALVLSLLAAEARPLSAVVAELPRYEMIKRKYELSDVGGREAVPAMLDHVVRAFSGERVDTADGARIDFDEGWVHLRPSNTEPIVRLIGEARSRSEAEGLIERVARVAGLRS